MGKPIIEARNIAKVYRLGEIGATSLREEASRYWRKARGFEPKKDKSEFWALRDISFDVQPGEVLGIIGKNGAGKSTLLKILSRITEPTTGEIRLRGRVAALLEIGTGFHGELTGRENIYLNGTILGMKKREIDRKLDEIIDFSGIEKHIDTPVKRYSSGMNVRLGFAVAAHLDPEILIIDEVLAVGDIEFQKKCLGKMRDVSQGEGRTVLFVSHNMGSVRTLTSHALLLEKGRILQNGITGHVVAFYNSLFDEKSQKKPFYIRKSTKGNSEQPNVLRAEVFDQSEMRVYQVLQGEPFTIAVNWRVPLSYRPSVFVFRFYANDNRFLTAINSKHCLDTSNENRNNYNLKCLIEPNLFPPWPLEIRLCLWNSHDGLFEDHSSRLHLEISKSKAAWCKSIEIAQDASFLCLGKVSDDDN